MIMKKTTLRNISIVLALICVISGIQIAVDAKIHRQERKIYITSLCNAATGVSLNIKEALKNIDDTLDESMIGIRVYMDMLTKHFMVANNSSYSYNYNILFWEKSFFLDSIEGYLAITSARDKYTDIFERHFSGSQKSSSDHVFLQGLQVALNNLCGRLLNEDKSLNKKAINSVYYSESLSEFISAIKQLN